MQNLIALVVVCLIAGIQSLTAQVSINETVNLPDNSAMLDVSSSNRGILIPRMTAAQVSSISLPATGLLIYLTNGTPGFYYNAGTPVSPDWQIVGHNAGTFSQWTTTGSDIYFSAGNVGIGTAAPSGSLHVKGNVNQNQLVIDADVTQSNTNPLILLRNSVGTDLLHIHSDAPSNSFFGLNAGSMNNYIAGVQGMENTFIGNDAGQSNNSGNYNTAGGSNALEDNTSGSGNAAFGIYALGSNLTGNYNVAMGWGALYSSKAGNNATAVGDHAMHFANNTTSSFENKNVALGYEALMGSSTPASNTGNGNTAVGYKALRSNSTGIDNSAAGVEALFNNTTGARNNAIGNLALKSNLTGSNNIGIGYSALFANTSGSLNIAIGLYGLNNNATGGYNLAIGYGALFSNNAGTNGIALGNFAMYNANNSTSPFTNFNIAIGYEALKGSTTPASNTGNFNTVIGYQTLTGNTSGNNNTALGSGTLFTNTTGHSNTAIGSNTLADNISGFSNTAIGKDALNNSTGNSNTALGHAAGFSSTTGNNNTFLGFGTSTSLGTYSNATTVGWLAQAGASNTMVLGSISGVNGATADVNVGIGISAPIYKLHVVGANSILGYFNNTQVLSDAFGLYASCINTPYYGYGVYGAGGWVGVQGEAILAGTGDRYGVKGEGSNGNNYNYGVYGSAHHGTISYGIYGDAYGAQTNYAGYFNGNTHVNGTLSKAAGSFKIDHPLDPENKYLLHSFVESPDMMNVYNGNIMTNEASEAVVELPEYFDVLNRDFRYQLTVIDGTFARAVIAEKISGNHFTIRTDQPNVEVSWQVTGIRKDPYAEAHRIPVEAAKEPENVGKYMHWEEWGQTRDKALDPGIDARKTDKIN